MDLARPRNRYLFVLSVWFRTGSHLWVFAQLQSCLNWVVYLFSGSLNVWALPATTETRLAITWNSRTIATKLLSCVLPGDWWSARALALFKMAANTSSPRHASRPCTLNSTTQPTLISTKPLFSRSCTNTRAKTILWLSYRSKHKKILRFDYRIIKEKPPKSIMCN